MRAALCFAIACAGGACMPTDPGPGGPGDPGFPNPGNPQGSYCSGPGDCGAPDVCTRDHECLPPDQVRSVMTRWTIGGQPAGTATCPTLPAGELEIAYSSRTTGEYTGFAPLRCDEGQFFVDVWPARFDHVKVDVQGTSYAGEADLSADATDADVTVDLAAH